MKEVMITLLVCVVIYEIFEHVILPLFWTMRYRRRKSAYGPPGMIGKRCVVKQWENTRGKVSVGGELWNATSESQLIPGSEAVIRDINNLTLMVAPSEKLIETTNDEIHQTINHQGSIQKPLLIHPGGMFVHWPKLAPVGCANRSNSSAPQSCGYPVPIISCIWFFYLRKRAQISLTTPKSTVRRDSERF